MFYGVVFTRDFPPGEHWKPGVPKDDPDRKQFWHTGDLYSISDTRPDDLPLYFTTVEIPAWPRTGEVWDRHQRKYVELTPGAVAKALVDSFTQQVDDFVTSEHTRAKAHKVLLHLLEVLIS